MTASIELRKLRFEGLKDLPHVKQYLRVEAKGGEVPGADPTVHLEDGTKYTMCKRGGTTPCFSLSRLVTRWRILSQYVYVCLSVSK